MEDCSSFAIEIDRGHLFAKHLRRSKREWSQSDMLPPKSMWRQHVKCDTLINDEGVTVSVREYRNTASWNVTPKGICDVVRLVLQSKVAANAMSLDCILEDRPKAGISRGVSLRTAHRWSHKLGWIWSRDRKGYIHGHV